LGAGKVYVFGITSQNASSTCPMHGGMSLQAASTISFAASSIISVFRVDNLIGAKLLLLHLKLGHLTIDAYFVGGGQLVLHFSLDHESLHFK
jgi:hypothetical protein